MSIATRLFIVTIGSVLVPAAPFGQAPPGQSSSGQPQLPTFRAEGRAIEVDVHVTDAQGRFVRGLTRDDFELLEDDQPQEISAFTMIDLPVERTLSSPSPKPQKGAPPPPSPAHR